MQNKNTIAEKKAKLEELEKKAEQLKKETEAIKNKTEEYQKSEEEILQEMIQEQNSKWKPSIDSMTATDRIEYSKGGTLEWNQMKGGYTTGELNEQITTPVNQLPNTSVEKEEEIPKIDVDEGAITTPQTPTPEQKPEEEKEQIQIPGGNIVEDKTNENIASVIGVSPYFAKDYIFASQQFSLEKIYQNIELIKEYDLKTKGLGSNFDNNELFKELVFKLTH